MLKNDKKNSTNNLRSSIIQGEEDTDPFLDKLSRDSYQNIRYVKKSFAPQFYGNTESHQYEPDESEVWRHHQLLRSILLYISSHFIVRINTKI